MAPRCAVGLWLAGPWLSCGIACSAGGPQFVDLEAPEDTVSVVWGFVEGGRLTVRAQSFDQPLLFLNKQADVLHARTYPSTLESLGIPEGKILPGTDLDPGTLPASPHGDRRRAFAEGPEGEWVLDEAGPLETFRSPVLPVDLEGCFDFSVEATLLLPDLGVINRVIPWVNDSVLVVGDDGTLSFLVEMYGDKDWRLDPMDLREHFDSAEPIGGFLDWAVDEARTTFVLTSTRGGSELWVRQPDTTQFDRHDVITSQLAIRADENTSRRIYAGEGQLVAVGAGRTQAFDVLDGRLLWELTRPIAEAAITAGEWLSFEADGVYRWPDGVRESLELAPEAVSFGMAATSAGLLLASSGGASEAALQLVLRRDRNDWDPSGSANVSAVRAGAYGEGAVISSFYGTQLYWSPRVGLCDIRERPLTGIFRGDEVRALPHGRLAIAGVARGDTFEPGISILRGYPTSSD